MTSSDGRGTPQVFLSHSGRDKDYADMLTSVIVSEFGFRGYKVNVFNTSDSEYRFSKWKELSRKRDVFRVAAARSEKKLRAYLSSNLAASSAYVLLVTGLRHETGLGKGNFGDWIRDKYTVSDWIRWEIQEGTALAREKNVPFLPILVDVELSRVARDLPAEALSFQAIEIDFADIDQAQRKLNQIVPRLLEHPLWGKAWEEDPRPSIQRLIDKNRGRRWSS